jgi:hypothetical protein
MASPGLCSACALLIPPFPSSALRKRKKTARHAGIDARHSTGGPAEIYRSRGRTSSPLLALSQGLIVQRGRESSFTSGSDHARTRICIGQDRRHTARTQGNRNRSRNRTVDRAFIFALSRSRDPSVTVPDVYRCSMQSLSDDRSPSDILPHRPSVPRPYHIVSLVVDQDTPLATRRMVIPSCSEPAYPT